MSLPSTLSQICFFFLQAEDGIRDGTVTGVQTCALPISAEMLAASGGPDRSRLGKDELMAEFFLKPSSSIIGPGGTILLPKISKDVDYEAELCAVIGTRARRVSEAQALEHVFGYTICWDISQRDPWGRGRQNTRNIRKGFDSFTGLGPWIVTRDELPEPQDVRIEVELNGRPAMTAHTSDMICGLRDHIRFLSNALTLRPGDLITTGTPAGVAKLAPGDKLRGRIERIGEMTLNVESEALWAASLELHPRELDDF